MRGRRREGAAHLLAPRAHLLRLPRDEALPIQLLHHWLPRAGRAVVVPAAAAALHAPTAAAAAAATAAAAAAARTRTKPEGFLEPQGVNP